MRNLLLAASVLAGGSATIFAGSLRAADLTTPAIVDVTEVAEVLPGDILYAEAICPNGLSVTGGGFHLSRAFASFSVTESEPDESPQGWRAGARNISGTAQTTELTAYAICA